MSIVSQVTHMANVNDPEKDRWCNRAQIENLNSQLSLLKDQKEQIKRQYSQLREVVNLRLALLIGFLFDVEKIDQKMKVPTIGDEAEDLYIQFECQNHILFSAKAHWDTTLAQIMVIYKNILSSK